MQVMPHTAKDPGYGLKPSDGTPADDARLGREYLAKMVQVYGNPAQAWAAYNAGPGAVDKAIEKGGDKWLQYLPKETQNYVAKNMVQLRGGGQQGSGTRVIAQGQPKRGYELLTPEQNKQLGLDPNVLAPSQLVEPGVGQPATPALPVPFPRTGQGGDPRLTLPDAIIGNPGDQGCGPPGVPLPGPTGCYPYREPLPAPAPDTGTGSIETTMRAAMEKE
jgi:hypothetical protein